MTISIFTTDTNLIVRSWDPRLAQMTGLSAETAVGLHLGTLSPDLEKRGFAARFARVLTEGVVETLAPALHHYLIPCPPLTPSKYYEHMQQRVTIGPLRDKDRVVGTIVTLEDVTPRLDRERELAEHLTRPEGSATDSLNPSLLDPEAPGSFTAGPILQALQDKNWQVRREAVDRLAVQNNPDLTQELLQLLRTQHRNPGILNGVLQVLALSQVDMIPALVECLRDSDPDLRIYAALALGERADPRGIQPLICALEDVDANVRYHAIDALGQLRSPEAVESLVALAESNDFFLAFPALDALMRICDTAIAPRLLPLLKNTLSWRVRREAVDNLARQNDPAISLELLRMLREQHRNPNVLNSILQILVLSDVDPIPSLIECLKDPDPDLRIYTALALGERHDQRAVPSLIEALQDPDTNVIFHAVEALGRLRAIDAVEPLVTLAESPDFFLAFPAIDALIRIGDRTIAPRLTPMLEKELLSAQIADALGQLGDADVVESLAEKLNLAELPIPELAVAIAAIYHRYQSLFGEGIHIADLTRAQINPTGEQHLITALNRAKPPELQALALILGWLEGEAIEQTLSQLLGNPQVRDIALEALVRYGTRISPLLINQLDSEDVETRSSAIIALGRIGSTQAVPFLIEQLLNPESDLVMVTAAALAQIGDRSSFEALINLLGHPDISVRLCAIAALNSLGHPAMPHRISTLLLDPNPHRRESAVKIAGYFAFSNCIDLLFELCQDPEERVRRAAIEHLPYLEEEERALPVLACALSRDTPPVRAAAARALGEIASELSYQSLVSALEDPDSWVRYYAIKALVALGENREKNPFPAIDGPSFLGKTDKLLPTLENLALHDPANPVRASATEALGHFGQAQAVEILAAIAQGTEEDLIRAALRALGRIQHPSALTPLLTALNSDQAERRMDALQAFKERGGIEAGVALQWLGAADPETRVVQAAIDSLARMGTPEAVASLLDLTVDPTCREPCINTLANRGTIVERQSQGAYPAANPTQVSIEAYIEAVGGGLRHAHPAVRSAVVEILTRLKHPCASELLIGALDDSDAHVRLAAVTALGHLGNRGCEDKLVILARTDADTTVRRAARKGRSLCSFSL